MRISEAINQIKSNLTAGQRVVFMLCGPSGSGKSTMRSYLLDEFGGLAASSDDHLMRIAAAEGITYTQAYIQHKSDSEAHFEHIIAVADHEQTHLTLDRTFLKTSSRAKWIAHFAAQNVPVIAIYNARDYSDPVVLAEMSDRIAGRSDRGGVPDFVVPMQIKTFEPPREDEGFLSVLRISDIEPRAPYWVVDEDGREVQVSNGMGDDLRHYRRKDDTAMAVTDDGFVTGEFTAHDVPPLSGVSNAPHF